MDKNRKTASKQDVIKASTEFNQKHTEMMEKLAGLHEQGIKKINEQIDADTIQVKKELRKERKE